MSNLTVNDYNQHHIFIYSNINGLLRCGVITGREQRAGQKIYGMNKFLMQKKIVLQQILILECETLGVHILQVPTYEIGRLVLFSLPHLTRQFSEKTETYLVTIFKSLCRLVGKTLSPLPMPYFSRDKIIDVNQWKME